MNYTASVDLITKRLRNSNECAYLYDVYEKELQSTISTNYRVNCPALVAQLISKYAHSTKDLHSIFRTKLFPKYFNDLYGLKSSFYRKTLIFNTASNLFIVTDQIITSLKYLFHINNTSYISYSFLFSISWFAFAVYLDSTYNKLELLNTIISNHNINRNTSSNLETLELYRTLYGHNIISRKSIYELLLSPHPSMQSLCINANNWIRHNFYIQSHSFYIYLGYITDNILFGAVNFILSIMYSFTTNSLICNEAKPRTQSIVPLPHNMLMKLIWDKSYNANNIGIRIQKLGLYAMSFISMSSYLIANSFHGNNNYYNNQFVVSNTFHFGARMCSFFCDIVESTIPSFGVHFYYYNKYILRLLAVIGHNIGYFYDITHWILVGQNRKNKVLHFWDESEPFDLGLFDWMDN